MRNEIQIFFKFYTLFIVLISHRFLYKKENKQKVQITKIVVQKSDFPLKITVANELCRENMKSKMIKKCQEMIINWKSDGEGNGKEEVELMGSEILVIYCHQDFKSSKYAVIIQVQLSISN